MPYISSDGTVGGSRDYFSVQGLLGFFWAIVNFFQLFFRTLISPDDNKRGSGYTSDYRAPGRGGPGGPGGPGGAPRRRMGGFSCGPGAAGPPPMAGGG
ncbi:selenoprotein K-like [Pollicipes pollicipes]|uniref:selenoprotein K-like n=1 Tax=Pollicipes pollicipes TaxID=41117 RepID=UPI001884DBFE|nr:selenoprotein K-like [Pollicipes pollicipes]